ncbi:MAG: R3H domain-containing nucleic acid-binding protein [Micrococcaceae bacterium]|nr:R3H domain-containing nucleic acid-binding protein [Micrococcaceae bacterium]
MSHVEQSDAIDNAVPNEETENLDVAISIEEEGDIAADYLEELLDIADLDGDIDIEVRGGRTYISIAGEPEDEASLRRLIGSKGEVLDALQELTRLAVLTATGSRSRLVLDITGYRHGRANDLKRIAEEAAAKVKAGADDVSLDPMSAYERKLVHDFVAGLGMHSESSGEGPRRHIVVSHGDA